MTTTLEIAVAIITMSDVADTLLLVAATYLGRGSGIWLASFFFSFSFSDVTSSLALVGCGCGCGCGWLAADADAEAEAEGIIIDIVVIASHDEKSSRYFMIPFEWWRMPPVLRWKYCCMHECSL